MRKVYNITEDLVLQQLEDSIKQFPGACRCEQCMADVMAMTLNKITPRYVSSDKGSVMARVFGSHDTERINILREVTNAIEKITSNPHHAPLPEGTPPSTITLHDARIHTEDVQ